MMISRFSSLLVILTCAFAVAGTGCKLKKKKDEEKAAEVQQAQAAAVVQQKATEEDKLEAAQRDLNDRIRVFRAIEGKYAGGYIGGMKTHVSVEARITLVNLPPEYVRAVPLTSSEVRDQTNALAFDVEISELITARENIVISCNATRVKPDMHNGTLRVSCTPAFGGATRTYLFGLDVEKQRANMEFAERGKSAASLLVQNKISTVELLNVRILGSNVEPEATLERID